MSKKILITGGAGFVGVHLAQELLQHGHSVRVLDNLAIHVHGSETRRPGYLHPDVELIIGDLRDPQAVSLAMDGIDVAYHLAAFVEPADGAPEPSRCTSVNVLGTSVLLDAIAQQPIERLVLASSAGVYGEGLYQKANGQTYQPPPRCPRQLRQGQWNVIDPDGLEVTPLPAIETTTPLPCTLQGLSKYQQEQLCQMVATACGLELVVLRLCAVYGPHQPIAPRGGVLSQMAASLLTGAEPTVFEDGQQLRDFLHVRDVATALRLAMEVPQAAGCTVNIGSGAPLTVAQIAKQLALALQSPHARGRMTGQFRKGDVRHCTMNIDLARKLLSFEPQIELDQGLPQLAHWLQEQDSGQVAA